MLEQFAYLGKRAGIMDALMKLWVAGAPAEGRRGELPLDNAVVRFP